MVVFWWGLSPRLKDDQLLVVSLHDLSFVCMHRERQTETKISSFYKDTSTTGLRSHPTTSFNFNYLSKSLISKYWHIGIWGINVWRVEHKSVHHVTHTWNSLHAFDITLIPSSLPSKKLPFTQSISAPRLMRLGFRKSHQIVK